MVTPTDLPVNMVKREKFRDRFVKYYIPFTHKYVFISRVSSVKGGTSIRKGTIFYRLFIGVLGGSIQ